MNGLRIIFAGSGEFGLPTLKHLLACGAHIVQVVTQPDRPSGRGQRVLPTPIAQFAMSRALPLMRTDSINRRSLVNADVLVVIAFGQWIAPHIRNHARLGAINLHASRLPRHRGAAPINAAMLAGDDVTGNTVIRLADVMDAGAILGQSEVTIGQTETAGELHDRLAEDGALLMERVISELAAGTAKEVEQDHDQATLAPKLSREDTLIDWTKSADAIARQIRAMYPWPGCRVRLLDQQGNPVDKVTLVRACPCDFYYPRETLRSFGVPPPAVMPGEIANPYHYPVGKYERIGAGDGRGVEILELKPEGKRVMPLLAYRNGHRWEVGMRVESIVET